MTVGYSPDERRRILADLEEGAARCPRCGRALRWAEVPERRDVAYVRRRAWLTCDACKLTVVVDRPPAEGPSGAGHP